MNIDLRTCNKWDLLKRRDGVTVEYKGRTASGPDSYFAHLCGCEMFHYSGKFGAYEDGRDIIEILTTSKPSRVAGVVAYCRVSTEEQAVSGLGLAARDFRSRAGGWVRHRAGARA